MVSSDEIKRKIAEKKNSSFKAKNTSNGYLLCDKCGGYYELQEGEVPEDFEMCECGGKLIAMDIPNKPLKKPKEIFCSNCGSPNPDNALYCHECGKVIGKFPEKKPKRQVMRNATIVVGAIIGVWLLVWLSFLNQVGGGAFRSDVLFSNTISFFAPIIFLLIILFVVYMNESIRLKQK